MTTSPAEGEGVPAKPESTEAQPVIINFVQVLQGLDEEGDMAVWFDHNEEMDVVTAIGLCEMAKAYFLGIHQRSCEG